MKYSLQSDDKELIQGCLLQNRLAQKYLYEKYYGQMLGICMRYSKDREEATEILNIAFLKVFTKLDMYQPTGSFPGWIARIVFNCSIDYVRKNTKYNKTMNFEIEKENAVHNEAINHIATEELFDIIQKLPPSSRNVFSLYVIDGFKHHEIAKQLGISEGTSKWHLSAARKALREMISYESRIPLTH